MVMSSSAVRGEGRTDLLPPTKMTREIFDIERMAARANISRYILEGMDISYYEDFITDSVVFEISKLVAAKKDDGGPVECWVDSPFYIKPKWLPNFLWKRMKTENRRYMLRVEPRWLFPEYAVPVMGNPTRHIEVFRYEE